MVYLKTEIERLKIETLEDNNSLEKYFYNYINNIKNENIQNVEVHNSKDLAIMGYLKKIVENENIISIISKPPVKGISYINNIYELLGIYILAKDNLKIKEELNLKYSISDMKHKFVISLIENEYEKRLYSELKEKEKYNSCEYIIYYILSDEYSDINSMYYEEFITNSNELIDLIILEKLLSKTIINDVSYNLSKKDIIVNILDEFSNACKKITQERRLGHSKYEINDEYDVQDLLQVIFKSVFPTIVPEENAYKVGGKTERADFFFREFKIVLEIKMIKAGDKSEQPFIGQIKNDIQSYYSLEPKYMIFYIYDPFDKTKDRENFNQLNGKQSFEWEGKKVSSEIIVLRGI